MKWETTSFVSRHQANPVLSAKDVPYHATLVFNAGITKYQGKYVMVFRNDFGEEGNPQFEGTNIGLAFSDDGIRWEVTGKPWIDRAKAFELTQPFYLNRDSSQIVRRMYDPRLTVVDGRCYMCCAVDTNHGIRGGMVVTEDFESMELVSLSLPENRNMVLFPEKVEDRFVRLERPMPVYSLPKNRHKFDVWLSDSTDLKYWGNHSLVLGTEEVAFCNDKIGPAAPPVKTKHGWLTTFHSVERFPDRGRNGWEPHSWQKVYYAGIMLLDLKDPRKVIGRHRAPLLAPEAPYEKENGFRNDVIFPGGMVLEDSGEVKIYYGAADTVECLATANVDDLVKLCMGEKGQNCNAY